MDETQQVPNQNAIIPASPTTTYPTPQPVHTSKAPWLLIFLIVVLIGIASYFGYQFTQLKKLVANNQAVSTPSPTTQSTNSPQNTTSIDISNWKNYIGDGYEVSYPSNFMVDISTVPNPIIYLQTKNPNECSYGGCNLGYRPLSITFETESNSQSLTEIVKARTTEIKNVNGNDVEVTSTNTTFAGFPSITLENQCLGYCKAVLFKNANNSLFTITQVYGSKSEMETYGSTADRILSTFKFTK